MEVPRSLEILSAGLWFGIFETDGFRRSTSQEWYGEGESGRCFFLTNRIRAFSCAVYDMMFGIGLGCVPSVFSEARNKTIEKISGIVLLMRTASI